MAGMERTNETHQGQADLCAGKKAHHLAASQLLWHPGQLDGEKTKHWQDGNNHSRHENLKLDASGQYRVSEFDTLSTVAERSLHGQGIEKPGRKALHNEMDRIISLNKCQYPDLAKHRDLLLSGMELNIGRPRTEPHQPHPLHADAPSHRPLHTPAARPELSRQYNDQPDYAPAPQSANPMGYARAQQYGDRAIYAQRPQADVGQGIAEFLGSFVGGMGRGFINASFLGGHHRGYARGWEQPNYGPMGYSSNWGNPGWGQSNWRQSSWEQPGWERYDRPIGYRPLRGNYDTGMIPYDDYSGGYERSWRGGYSRPRQVQSWFGF